MSVSRPEPLRPRPGQGHHRPVLKMHGVALTRHFYARMFEHNPELKHIFNQGTAAATSAGRRRGRLCRADR